MYCRNCGASVHEKAEICVKCGCKVLNGTDYCQECGARTIEKQEVCVKCGCRLRRINSYGASNRNVFGVLSGSDEENLDFDNLDSYYKKEFTKIYESQENYKGGFNICAFLFGALWALTKGLWVSAIVSIVIGICTEGIGAVVYWFIFGFRGTYMYYQYYVHNKQCVM